VERLRSYNHSTRLIQRYCLLLLLTLSMTGTIVMMLLLLLLLLLWCRCSLLLTALLAFDEEALLLLQLLQLPRLPALEVPAERGQLLRSSPAALPLAAACAG
jgi:hypothetical protein